MVSNADIYFNSGCGRCPLMDTPQCKVKTWEKELAILRKIVLGCGLQETLKWGVAVYTYKEKNLLTIGALKDNCVLSFFEGALLEDALGLLQKPGENTQGARVMSFTKAKDIVQIEAQIKAYIYEAIELEKAGLKVEYKKTPEPIPEEFQKRMKEMPALKKAFEALTPGRQRSYILHFAQAKQPKTRESRIEKCIPLILKGIGFHEK